MLASKMMVPRAVVSLVIMVVLIIVFARAFCGWMCPVPLVQKLRGVFTKPEKQTKAEKAKAVKQADAKAAEAAADIAPLTEDEKAALATGCEKDSKGLSGCASCAKKRGEAVDARHFVLGGALLSTFIFGFPVFCLICPIGLTFATILLLVNLFAQGDVTWSLIVVPAILIAEVLLFKKWCHKLCPLSAFMSLIAKLNPHVQAHHRQREVPGNGTGQEVRCLRSRLRGGHRPAPSRAVRGCVERMHEVPLVRGRLPGARDQHAADRQERRTRLAGGKREVAGKRIRQTRTLRREERNTGTARARIAPGLPGRGWPSKGFGDGPPSARERRLFTLPSLPTSEDAATPSFNLRSRSGQPPHSLRRKPPHRPTSWRKGPGNGNDPSAYRRRQRAPTRLAGKIANAYINR